MHIASDETLRLNAELELLEIRLIQITPGICPSDVSR